MKRIIFCVTLIVVIAGASVSAWEPADLLTYPSCMNEDNWIINIGMGIGDFDKLGSEYYTWLPSIRVSFDKNVPLGGLPFSMGGLVSYIGHSYKFSGNGNLDQYNYFYHRMTAAFRIVYHFNFDVDNLDVYATTAGGWTFGIYTGKRTQSNTIGNLYIDSKAGARYFFTDNLGVWAEAGFSPFSFFNAGIAFKF